MAAVRALAATGALGTGFKEETLKLAIEMQPDFVGCDAGSTDAGPYYLGSGESIASAEAIRRDLKLILRYAVPAGIPVLIGSAGTGGGHPHLAKTLDIVRDIAATEGLTSKLAAIRSEQVRITSPRRTRRGGSPRWRTPRHRRGHAAQRRAGRRTDGCRAVHGGLGAGSGFRDRRPGQRRSHLQRGSHDARLW